MSLTSLADIYAARTVHAGRLHRTPLLSSAYLGTRTQAHVSLKLELFQKTGSFTVRGVLNALAVLSAEERARGVISLSAGNHAQALAWGATSLGLHATIVMPEKAVRSKVSATQAYGGEVVLTSANLLDTCRQLQRERRMTLVHPFDDPRIIAGAATCGLEIAEDLPEVDVVLVGCGGGGLLSGIAAAVKLARPAARVVGVEPAGATGMTQSLARGEPVTLDRLDTIADGLAAPFTGVHTLAHAQAFVDQMVTVSDAEIVDAMRLLAERCKVFAEPAAAAATAALLSGRVPNLDGRRVAVVVSGGNIDVERFADLIASTGAAR